MRLIKKTFLIRLFLSSHSSPLYPSSSNSFHSTKEFSIIIRKSKSANCSLIAPAPVAISRFRNVAKPGVEKKASCSPCHHCLVCRVPILSAPSPRAPNRRCKPSGREVSHSCSVLQFGIK
ncbi:hypothetical protein PVAP13_8NG213609 [Panicum virgatum]|uniref:Uncharacterized protein n=1 Tax=Panicum virgatum TaxID=38727 RepID=A0A8T0P9U0_PANVG|nr:hypothetical protein PVAP13_8NG213609 [Panicum virgatum]